MCLSLAGMSRCDDARKNSLFMTLRANIHFS
jgi:hypothetical protein